jgi:hypothetical protein
MVDVEVHARKDKIELEIRSDKYTRLWLNPDEAMELGIQLLRAAYTTKVEEG